MKHGYRQWLALLMMAGTALAADSILKLDSIQGSPDSSRFIVTVSMENPVPVEGLQVWIADLPNVLQPDSVWISKRCSGFNLTYNDLNGNLSVILYAYKQAIQPDTGAVIHISYLKTNGLDTTTPIELRFSQTPSLMGENYTRLPVQTVNGRIILQQGESGVEAKVGRPAEFQLAQNYPNPFNPTTQISFNLGKTDWVTLTIYNSLGQQVRTLVSDRRQPGFHMVSWDGCDDRGRPVSGGLYLYRLATADQSLTKAMVFLR